MFCFIVMVADGLVYFEDLLDKECFQSNSASYYTVL
jgi:hypothetical protein